jgi:expansin (peptidoglycan-binding protein)
MCTWGTAYNGNASFTWYYFGQGTSQQGGQYKTACGYTGTESGSGQSAVDTVNNIANMSPAKNSYFAAIPGASSSNFDTVTDCGACVEITNGGNKIVATIIDECPTSSNPSCTGGHLDLSTQAFNALGYSVGNPSGTTWKFVPCPVTGSIMVEFNGSNEVYFQNSTFPIKSVSGATTTNYGAWHFGSAAAGQTVTLTDSVGQTLQVTIPGSAGSTGVQFTAPTGCY